MFDQEDRGNSSGGGINPESAGKVPPGLNNNNTRLPPGGRRVDNLGPILLSPGGTFNMPADSGFSVNDSESAENSDAEGDSPQSKLLNQNSDGNPASDSNNQLIKRDLFGGAISMQIPGSFQDVSEMREVCKTMS